MLAKPEDWWTLEKAVETWGVDAQAKMLLEEMAELQKEICKALRGADNAAQIAEEVADVEIMLEQVKLIFDIREAVKSYTDAKMGRLRLRLRYTEKGDEGEKADVLYIDELTGKRVPPPSGKGGKQL